MIKLLKRSIASLNTPQKRWILFAIFVTALVTILCMVYDKDWTYILFVIGFFGLKELLEYGRRRANSKAKWH
ncbi:MAG: hypothetical protein EOO85_03550 [Pedobacter sp.]|nr:MAG: hypothetical protein EOO85_03550 [Pedobacter sp.]